MLWCLGPKSERCSWIFLFFDVPFLQHFTLFHIEIIGGVPVHVCPCAGTKSVFSLMTLWRMIGPKGTILFLQKPMEGRKSPLPSDTNYWGDSLLKIYLLIVRLDKYFPNAIRTWPISPASDFHLCASACWSTCVCVLAPIYWYGQLGMGTLDWNWKSNCCVIFSQQTFIEKYVYLHVFFDFIKKSVRSCQWNMISMLASQASIRCTKNGELRTH